MLEMLFRLVADIGLGVTWAAASLTAIIAVFVAYISIAILVTLRARDAEQFKIRYLVFIDLLGIFCRRDCR